MLTTMIANSLFTNNSYKPTIYSSIVSKWDPKVSNTKFLIGHVSNNQRILSVRSGGVIHLEDTNYLSRHSDDSAAEPINTSNYSAVIGLLLSRLD